MGQEGSKKGHYEPDIAERDFAHAVKTNTVKLSPDERVLYQTILVENGILRTDHVTGGIAGTGVGNDIGATDKGLTRQPTISDNTQTQTVDTTSTRKDTVEDKKVDTSARDTDTEDKTAPKRSTDSGSGVKDTAKDETAPKSSSASGSGVKDTTETETVPKRSNNSDSGVKRRVEEEESDGLSDDNQEGGSEYGSTLGSTFGSTFGSTLRSTLGSTKSVSFNQAETPTTAKQSSQDDDGSSHKSFMAKYGIRKSPREIEEAKKARFKRQRAVEEVDVKPAKALKSQASSESAKAKFDIGGDSDSSDDIVISTKSTPRGKTVNQKSDLHGDQDIGDDNVFHSPPLSPTTPVITEENLKSFGTDYKVSRKGADSKPEQEDIVMKSSISELNSGPIKSVTKEDRESSSSGSEDTEESDTENTVIRSPRYQESPPIVRQSSEQTQQATSPTIKTPEIRVSRPSLRSDTTDKKTEKTENQAETIKRSKSKERFLQKFSLSPPSTPTKPRPQSLPRNFSAPSFDSELSPRGILDMFRRKKDPGAKVKSPRSSGSSSRPQKQIPPSQPKNEYTYVAPNITLAGRSFSDDGPAFSDDGQAEEENGQGNVTSGSGNMGGGKSQLGDNKSSKSSSDDSDFEDVDDWLGKTTGGSSHTGVIAKKPEKNQDTEENERGSTIDRRSKLGSTNSKRRKFNHDDVDSEDEDNSLKFSDSDMNALSSASEGETPNLNLTKPKGRVSYSTVSRNPSTEKSPNQSDNHSDDESLVDTSEVDLPTAKPTPRSQSDESDTKKATSNLQTPRTPPERPAAPPPIKRKRSSKRRSSKNQPPDSSSSEDESSIAKRPTIPPKRYSWSSSSEDQGDGKVPENKANGGDHSKSDDSDDDDLNDAKPSAEDGKISRKMPDLKVSDSDDTDSDNSQSNPGLKISMPQDYNHNVLIQDDGGHYARVEDSLPDPTPMDQSKQPQNPPTASSKPQQPDDVKDLYATVDFTKKFGSSTGATAKSGTIGQSDTTQASDTVVHTKSPAHPKSPVSLEIPEDMGGYATVGDLAPSSNPGASSGTRPRTFESESPYELDGYATVGAISPNPGTSGTRPITLESEDPYEDVQFESPENTGKATPAQNPNAPKGTSSPKAGQGQNQGQGQGQPSTRASGFEGQQTEGEYTYHSEKPPKTKKSKFSCFDFVNKKHKKQAQAEKNKKSAKPNNEQRQSAGPQANDPARNSGAQSQAAQPTSAPATTKGNSTGKSKSKTATKKSKKAPQQNYSMFQASGSAPNASSGAATKDEAQGKTSTRPPLSPEGSDVDLSEEDAAPNVAPNSQQNSNNEDDIYATPEEQPVTKMTARERNKRRSEDGVDTRPPSLYKPKKQKPPRPTTGPTRQPTQNSGPTEQPRTPNEQPGTPNEQPGTPNEQPGTPNEQPGTPNEQPGTPNEEPGTPNEQPGTPNEEPVTRNEEPGLPSEELGPSNQPLEPPYEHSGPSDEEQVSQTEQPESPMGQPESPTEQAESPNEQAESPNEQAESPNEQLRPSTVQSRPPTKQSRPSDFSGSDSEDTESQHSSPRTNRNYESQNNQNESENQSEDDSKQSQRYDDNTSEKSEQEDDLHHDDNIPVNEYEDTRDTKGNVHDADDIQNVEQYYENGESPTDNEENVDDTPEEARSRTSSWAVLSNPESEKKSQKESDRLPNQKPASVTLVNAETGSTSQIRTQEERNERDNVQHRPPVLIDAQTLRTVPASMLYKDDVEVPRKSQPLGNYGNKHWSKPKGKSHKPEKDKDGLGVKERSLEVQPKNRLSKAKLKALRKKTTSPADELLSDSDQSDASMESNCSAGLFEHVAKMGRIVDPKPAPSPAPKVLFRPSLQGSESLAIAMDTKPEKENMAPVKLQMASLTGAAPSEVGISRQAEEERLRNKQRQRELARRGSESSLASSAAGQDKDKDVDSSEAERWSRRKSRDKRAKRQDDPQTTAARTMQEARAQRWRRSQPQSEDSSTAGVGRNMRAAPKQRSRTTSSASSVYSQASSQRAQELLQQFEHGRAAADEQRALRAAAQELISHAYHDTAHRHHNQAARAQQLLDKAFPLAKSSSHPDLQQADDNKAPSENSAAPSEHAASERRASSSSTTPTPALGRLYAHPGHLPPPPRGRDGAPRGGAEGQRSAWGVSPGLAQPMTTAEREKLLSAIRQELNLMKPAAQ